MAFPRLLSSLDTWNSFIFCVCVCVCAEIMSAHCIRCSVRAPVCSGLIFLAVCVCVCVRDREKTRQIHAICLWASVLITAANWAVKPTSVLITHLLTALWAALLSAGAALTLHAFQKTPVRWRSVRDKFLCVVYSFILDGVGHVHQLHNA